MPNARRQRRKVNVFIPAAPNGANASLNASSFARNVPVSAMDAALSDLRYYSRVLAAKPVKNVVENLAEEVTRSAFLMMRTLPKSGNRAFDRKPVIVLKRI